MLRRSLSALFVCCGMIQATSYICSPPPGTPLCQFPAKIDITFVGTAVATNYTPNSPEDDPAFADIWYRFSVKEAFTGLQANEKEVVVRPSLGGGSPELGRPYFVHATRNGQQFRLAECGNTRRVEEAQADIDYLRARASGTFQPFIAGSVLRHYRGSKYSVEPSISGPPRGLADAFIRIKNADREYGLTTDDQGRYRVESASPGRYTVTAAADGYTSMETTTVEVPENGCGIAYLGLFTSAGIAGVVRRADGRPAAGVELELIDENPDFQAITDVSQAFRTGPDGTFSAAHLPGGRFLLGINIEESTRYPDQTPPTFYPGVASRAQAQVIDLAPNQHKTGLVLTLPPPRPFRSVRVHLHLPGGAIPSRGGIDAWANRGIYVSNHDVKDGVVDLRLLRGVDYWLTAAVIEEKPGPTKARGTWVYTDNYFLAGGEEPVEITLTAKWDEPQWPKAIYVRKTQPQ